MLVLNDTRVIARRVVGIREGGEVAEVLLMRPIGETQWEALVRPGKGLKPGRELTLIGPPPDHLHLTTNVTATTAEGGRLLQFSDRAQRDSIATWGNSPLPPYIQTQLPGDQENRYQTVYARADGSAAAPTAGLHFTTELLSAAANQGVDQTYVTLHVGVDTFRPVRAAEIETHEMHGEVAFLTAESAERINQSSGRIIAVGTTSVRVLESAAQAAQVAAAGNPQPVRVAPFTGVTHLFIAPGYRFRAVDALITNFHLPRSTLLMLICAFAGYDAVMTAYNEAIAQGYRFFSFGDAMLIL
jgi:S-adenosylmethionine:tRNA ribosyltransferase-isomerase